MTRKAKSDWDFGELFPVETGRRVYWVGELTTEVRRTLERAFSQVWVTGEVSNFRLQSSGHAYFTLKDSNAQLSCVLFRGTAVTARDLLEDGQRIIVQGQLTVYEPRGQYQLLVQQVELQGMGALQLAFERLKRRLESEGLFAQERKRSLPPCPWRIGLVTSPTGAAIRDVIHVVRRRNPGLEIVLVPCRVQGEGAAVEVAAAIKLLNEWSNSGGPERVLDLVLVTRGGGSLEDLWAFNEEAVARAIAGSALPVVSAIGHEIDFTIADFVADLRAATPSAAAELITEDVFASRQFVADVPGRLTQLATRGVESARAALAGELRRLAYWHPRRRFNERLQRLDDLVSGLARAARFRWRERDALSEQAVARLQALRPSRWVERQQRIIGEVWRRLAEVTRKSLQERRSKLATADARLRLLSPNNVVKRGYSITTDAATGRVIRRAADVVKGQRLRTLLGQGSIESEVREQGEAGEGTGDSRG
jgi:exodeoxyribonuclease VII large subunit